MDLDYRFVVEVWQAIVAVCCAYLAGVLVGMVVLLFKKEL